jgi:hypothetical protein
MVQERLPHAIQVGGTMDARGYTNLNGTQFEGFPNRNVGSRAPDYREIDGVMSHYRVQMHHGDIGPRYTELTNITSTRLYPYAGATVNSNAPFRFSFGLALLDDGYYGQENSNVTDPWWDEYAVDVVPGSPTYGRAIASNPQNESLIRRHTGWMGDPWGPRYRVYDTTAFAPERNLMPNGTFDSGLSGWSGTNVSLQIDTSAANRLDGAGVLRINKPAQYEESYAGARAKGPTVQLTAGVEYTLAFAAKSSSTRRMQVQLGSETEVFYIPEDWSRRVFTFKAPRTGSYTLQFGVGWESTTVWIDSIYLFKGNADVLRRDFDNATVVVNATPSRRTVDLGGTFRRIRGTGQDPINDGSTVRQVTIEPYDSAILIRP